MREEAHQAGVDAYLVKGVPGRNIFMDIQKIGKELLETGVSEHYNTEFLKEKQLF